MPRTGAKRDFLSMTGFGAGAARTGGWRAEVELRTVNGRYLSLKIHLPGEFGFLEDDLRAELEPELQRGNAELWAEVRPERAEQSLQLDEGRVRAYADSWKRLGRQLGLAGELSVAALAGQPEFFIERPDRAKRAGALAALLAAARAALGKLSAMRAREGRGLRTDLLQHVEALGKLRAEVVARSPEATKALVARAAARVEKLLAASPAAAGAAVRPEDIAREVTWWADRCDVAEEMQRLGSHLEQFRAALASGGPAGKRLDFLVQELHREANTAGSKSADTELARLTVEMKVHVEQLREQVQNAL